MSATRDLPPYRAILVIDAKAAFQRAELDEAWADRRFAAHTGDGYIVGLLPENRDA